MTIHEQARHDLFVRLEAVLGRDEAATLMEHLPPVGWADVATRRDLDVLQAAIKSDLALFRSDVDHRFDMIDSRFGSVDLRFARVEERLDRMDERFDWLRDKMDSQFRTIIFAVVFSLFTAVTSNAILG